MTDGLLGAALTQIDELGHAHQLLGDEALVMLSALGGQVVCAELRERGGQLELLCPLGAATRSAPALSRLLELNLTGEETMAARPVDGGVQALIVQRPQLGDLPAALERCVEMQLLLVTEPALSGLTATVVSSEHLRETCAALLAGMVQAYRSALEALQIVELPDGADEPPEVRAGFQALQAACRSQLRTGLDAMSSLTPGGPVEELLAGRGLKLAPLMEVLLAVCRSLQAVCEAPSLAAAQARELLDLDDLERMLAAPDVDAYR